MQRDRRVAEDLSETSVELFCCSEVLLPRQVVKDGGSETPEQKDVRLERPRDGRVAFKEMKRQGLWRDMGVGAQDRGESSEG